MNKIVCIVGESMAGKSFLAEYASWAHNMPILASYTDRPKRTHSETGHVFVSPRLFDKIEKDNMIAYTKFGGCRYCATKTQVETDIIYVIDEDGLRELKSKFSDEYEIISIRIRRSLFLRTLLQGVDFERVERDANRFTEDDAYFDYVINNDGLPAEYEAKIDEVFVEILTF